MDMDNCGLIDYQDLPDKSKDLYTRHKGKVLQGIFKIVGVDKDTTFGDPVLIAVRLDYIGKQSNEHLLNCEYWIEPEYLNKGNHFVWIGEFRITNEELDNS